MKQAMILITLVALAGCGGTGFGGGFGGLRGDDTAGAAGVPEDGTIRPVERPSEAAEAATGDATAFLGFTVASLGDATISGLWLETPLVSEEQPGRVIAEDGRVAFVTLRPSGGERGSGSRLSLQGFQILGIPLTALPTVTVSAVTAASDDSDA